MTVSGGAPGGGLSRLSSFAVGARAKSDCGPVRNSYRWHLERNTSQTAAVSLADYSGRWRAAARRAWPRALPTRRRWASPLQRHPISTMLWTLLTTTVRRIKLNRAKCRHLVLRKDQEGLAGWLTSGGGGGFGTVVKVQLRGARPQRGWIVAAAFRELHG